jgi:lipid-binding SYLF domain-containing protein
MKRIREGVRVKTLLVMVLFLLSNIPSSFAASAYDINNDVKAAYENLIASTPAAQALAEKAEGILIFPSIVKGGFIFGGQYGNGGLIQKGKITSYYNSTAVSYGLQAGVQQFGYALFFMSKEDMEYLDSSAGWEVGVGPSLVVMEEGMANSTTTTTLRSGVYAFFFSQKGLMAGLGLQGTKITEIYPL